MQSGKVSREHYSYEKNGFCALLEAIEPLTGTRQATVYERRTKKEYVHFLKALAACYLKAVKIRLVQDNLNSHNASSFYEHFCAQEAFVFSLKQTISKNLNYTVLSELPKIILIKNSAKAINKKQKCYIEQG